MGLGVRRLIVQLSLLSPAFRASRLQCLYVGRTVNVFFVRRGCKNARVAETLLTHKSQVCRCVAIVGVAQAQSFDTNRFKLPC